MIPGPPKLSDFKNYCFPSGKTNKNNEKVYVALDVSNSSSSAKLRTFSGMISAGRKS